MCDIVEIVMRKIIFLNKKEGETPLEALENFRKKNKKYKGLKITYAGRLDPMASGLLLLLVGEKIKEKDKYLKLDKEYNFEVLFGFSTDTYDILGKVIDIRHGVYQDLEKMIRKNIKLFSGKLIQKYPIYSSKTVEGKPLFSYARRGVDIEIPSREVLVKNLKFLKVKSINNRRLFNIIEKRIKKVNGDFRQKEILNIWKKNLQVKEKRNFFIASFKIECSSGTYVRGIANNLGEKINIPTLAFSIKRTKIGTTRRPNF